jgi:hypothetical protein
MQVSDSSHASLNPDVNPLNLTSNGLLLFGFINAAPPLFGSILLVTFAVLVILHH